MPQPEVWFSILGYPEEGGEVIGFESAERGKVVPPATCNDRYVDHLAMGSASVSVHSAASSGKHLGPGVTSGRQTQAFFGVVA